MGCLAQGFPLHVITTILKQQINDDDDDDDTLDIILKI